MPKKILHTLFLLLFFAFSAIGQDVEKTLVKSFNLQGNQIVTLDLDGPIDVVNWKNSTIRIQMTIQIANDSEAMLKSLVQAGRYNLRSTITGDAFKIYAPGLEKLVSVGGKTLEETISFIIFAPEDILINLGGEASSSLDINWDPSL